MSLFFQDKFHRIIRLSNERIKHIGKHMDLKDVLYLLEATLLHPDILTINELQTDVYYYQKYLKDEHLYFIVVVKMFNGTGFILTLYEGEKQKQ